MRHNRLTICLLLGAGSILLAGCAGTRTPVERAWHDLSTYAVGKTTEAEFREMWENVEGTSVYFDPPAGGRPPVFPGMTLDSAPTWTDAGVEMPEDWVSVEWLRPDFQLPDARHARPGRERGEPVMEWRVVRQDPQGRRYWLGAYWDRSSLKLYGLTFLKGILESVHGPVDAD